MEEKEVDKAILRCGTFGALRPQDVCSNCGKCVRNGFPDEDECPGFPVMLLIGSREALAAALRRPGVALDDVVVVNAKEFQRMHDALMRIAIHGDVSDDNMPPFVIRPMHILDAAEIAQKALTKEN